MHWKSTDLFTKRHIGPDQEEQKEMLKTIGVSSLEELIEQTVPEKIRLKKDLNLSSAVSERELLSSLKKLSQKNQVFRSFIGLGYYNCIIPPVIQRNIFENPGWYTQYTPYQAEISQGRLEALLNFQTLVADLTGMEIANASLLDEGTAAAEAMGLFFRLKNKRKITHPRFFVSENCFPQTIDILKTRAAPLGIDLVIGDLSSRVFLKEDGFFGILLSYPDGDGSIHDYSSLVTQAQEKNIYVSVTTDLLSLTLLTPPGEWGADAVVGSAQNFGVPLGYGGPHAAFFATRQQFQRNMPGRLVGVSHDRHGKKAYRLSLQTREQHIRREKATSNICTAQALLAIMASMYAVYHGPKGLTAIARRIHNLTQVLEQSLQSYGYIQKNTYYFNTLSISIEPEQLSIIRERALAHKINFCYTNEKSIGISLDETTLPEDIQDIVSIFAQAKNQEVKKIEYPSYESLKVNVSPKLKRQSPFLDHPVFHLYHTETKMMRYLKKLENRDLSLTSSMIPLGSCTMKLNAAAEMMALSWPEFSDIHPFVPLEQSQGYQEIFRQLEKDLCEITGFTAASLQPNSGAQGEYAGLMVIRAYHLDRASLDRDVVLIPSSAHGTNPASGVMAGMKVVIVKCDERGDVDFADLRQKVELHSQTLSCLMLTYPSTHGVFEESVREICDFVHEHGGLVYMDGANMNAQVGLTSPAEIGTDVCHLNLHKTFSIPHGGGGPGMGPICVAEHLAPYLPGHSLVKTGGEKAISAISSAPWSSASILLISYAYILMLGQQGVKEATRIAILNANYIRARLQSHYELLFCGDRGQVAHEMILNFQPFRSANINVEDVAKRLMDYGFHAPTMSWPVPDTIMIEPTESESKDELDRFCDALISIREEIQEVIEGKADPNDNVLKNAPHTAQEVVSENWAHSYSREKAAFPLPYTKENKFWTSVSRVDNVYGDRNLVCSCPPLEAYSGT